MHWTSTVYRVQRRENPPLLAWVGCTATPGGVSCNPAERRDQMIFGGDDPSGIGMIECFGSVIFRNIGLEERDKG